MKIINLKNILVILLVSIQLCSCSGNTIKINNDYYSSENKNEEQNVYSVNFTRSRDITASASGFQLLLFIPININDRHERAYQILKAQVGDDYIGEVKIKESWTYALVGTVYTTRLEAKVYKKY